MLTNRDKTVFGMTGNITPNRLEELSRGFRLRAHSAREAAKQATDEREAAALRGKATAYSEVVDVIASILAGNGIKRRWGKVPEPGPLPGITAEEAEAFWEAVRRD